MMEIKHQQKRAVMRQKRTQAAIKQNKEEEFCQILRVYLRVSSWCDCFCPAVGVLLPGSAKMAACPMRVYRGLLKEIRTLLGSGYTHSPVYKHVLDQFRTNQVTGARLCRARMEALQTALTYQCLLASTRKHLQLHELYHGRGERVPEDVAGLVGLRMPTQPGGKGWEA